MRTEGKAIVPLDKRNQSAKKASAGQDVAWIWAAVLEVGDVEREHQATHTYIDIITS